MNARADPELQGHPASQAGEPAGRLCAAKDPLTPPDTLDALSRDPDAQVRRSVAANPATPQSADLRLVEDHDERVRGAVGCKIAVVGFGTNSSSPKWRTGFSILESLAADSAVSVRRLLAQALTDGRNTPDAIINGMLQDSDPEVARILLHDTKFMGEHRVIQLMDGNLPSHAQLAIASRPVVSADLATVIVEKGSPATVKSLIENPAATISDATMSVILDRAPKVPGWHDALVCRPGMPDRFIVRIARFVAPALVNTLRSRADVRPEIRGAINRVTQARSELGSQNATRDAAFGMAPSAKPAASHDGKWQSAEDRALELFGENKLDDAAVLSAIQGEGKDFVIQALALRSGAPLAMATRIIDAGSGKAVAALCWRAELPLKMAIEVQEKIAKTPPANIVRGEGPYYPMLESEMFRLLFYFKG